MVLIVSLLLLSARNLGFIFDSDISFSDQINSIQILSLSHLRHPSNSSTSSSATALANSKKLDYCNLVSHKQISTNFNALNTRWPASLQTKYQHITPTLKQLHWLPIKESITNSVFSHTKNLKINNLYNSLISVLFLHDLLIHLFFLFYMSDHHLAKGLSLSSVHDSGIHSLLMPETRLLYQYSIPGSKHLFKIAIP